MQRNHSGQRSPSTSCWPVSYERCDESNMLDNDACRKVLIQLNQAISYEQCSYRYFNSTEHDHTRSGCSRIAQMIIYLDADVQAIQGFVSSPGQHERCHTSRSTSLIATTRTVTTIIGRGCLQAHAGTRLRSTTTSPSCSGTSGGRSSSQEVLLQCISTCGRSEAQAHRGRRRSIIVGLLRCLRRTVWL